MIKFILKLVLNFIDFFIEYAELIIPLWIIYFAITMLWLNAFGMF